MRKRTRGAYSGAVTRTTTRAGRVGSPSERNSRTAPSRPQYGHASASAGRSGPDGNTGASHSGQASVPAASTEVRVFRRSSRVPPTVPIGSGRSGSEPSMPRWMLTTPSVGSAVAVPSILLVRHAQASFGGERYDVLSDHGHVQVAALAADLKRRGVRIDEVVSGDLDRQRDTAQPIADAAGCELTIDPRWNEYATGDILGNHSDTELREERRPRDDSPPPSSRDFQAILERALDAWIDAGAAGPADESWTVFADRVQQALADLAARLGSGRTALVATSGGPLAALCVQLLDLPAPAFVAFNRVVVNAGITKVVSGRGGTTLVSFNEHAHLEQGEPSLVTYR